MSYRESLKIEEGILRKRLEILQGQINELNDLTSAILDAENTINELDREIGNKCVIVRKYKEAIQELKDECAEAKSKLSLTQKEIDDNKKTSQKQNKEYASGENRRFKRIEDNNIAIEKSNALKRKYEEETKKKKTEMEVYMNKYNHDQWILKNEAIQNEKRLEIQRKEEEEMKKKLKTLTADYEELDKEYQTLLEKYIINT